MNARILVLSDTHRDLYRQRQAVLQAGAVDYIFHLGDNVSDAAELKGLAPGAQLYCVRGNCDPGSSAPASELVRVAGHSILLTHGHNYAVKYSLTRLPYAAQEAGAEAVFFGHTHLPFSEYAGGVLLFNPGSLAHPRGPRPSFGLVLATPDGLFPRIAELG